MKQLFVVIAIVITLAITDGYVIQQQPSVKGYSDDELEFPWEQVLNTQRSEPRADATVCYDDVGCFSNTIPFNNMGGTLPTDPAKLQSETLLFTPVNQENYEILKYGDLEGINKSSFDPKLPIKIIIHGFQNDRNSPWITDFRKTLMQNEPSNFLVVDWGKGATFPDYNGAGANTRLVGKMTCMLLTDIMKVYFESNWRKTHTYCIGHSLGAHACGYTSNYCNSQLDRITGIDPAGPLFEGVDPLVRLDATDARFVDIIHGNAGSVLSASLGIVAPCGHVDFFPNGGSFQPGCPSSITSPSCSHNRVRELYLESITSTCPFTAFKCDNFNTFDQGKCMSCENNGCSEMGFYADQWRGRGSMFLSTSSKTPYCGYNYIIEIKVAANSSKTAGDLNLSLDSKDENGAKMLFGKDTDMKPNDIIRKVFASDRDLAEITPITITFNKKPKPFFGSDPNSPKMILEKVTIINVGVNEQYNSCGSSLELNDKKADDLVFHC